MDKEKAREAIELQRGYFTEEWAKLELLALSGKLTPEQHGNAIILLVEEVKEKIFITLELQDYVKCG